jgi:tRNA(adenine34) deaminase
MQVTRFIRFLRAMLVASGTMGLVAMPNPADNATRTIGFVELDEIEKLINGYTPDPRFPDDPFVKATLLEALAGSREGNGGIGACLVREATGEIVERGHNRQFEPYMRSDLHAEMDLLTRYEDRVKGVRMKGAEDPRKMKGLVLYSSVEPCPMCLTRIINTGLKKAFFAAPDPKGGMVQRFKDLPPFWQGLAAGNVYDRANCFPELSALAARLFRPMSGMKPVQSGN